MKFIAMMLLGTSAVLAQQSTAENAVTTPQAGSAATTTVTTTAAPTPGPNEMAGTIVAYNATALTLVVATPNSTAPITYVINTATAFVDEANKPIPGSLLISGSPVTVYFESTGTVLTARKVILRKLTQPSS